MRTGAALLAAVCAVAACGESTSTPPAPLPHAPGVRVFLAGCARVFSHGVCTLPADRELSLHVEPTGGCRPHLLGASVLTGALTGESAARIRVDDDSAVLEVRCEGTALTRIRRLAPPVGEDPVLARALALRNERKLSAASDLLAEGLEGLPPLDKALRLGALGRVQLRADRPDEAALTLRRAVDEAARVGLVSAQVIDSVALAHTLGFTLRQHARAQAVLDAARQLTGAFDEAWARVAYHEALLARETGDLAAALRRAEEAARWARRLGLLDVERAARVLEATLLPEVGEPAAAMDLLDALGSDPATPCDRGVLLGDRGWAGLLAVEAGAGLEVARAARAALDEARPLLATCATPDHEENVLVNQLFVAVALGDRPQARARLAETRARRSERSPRLGPWILDATGRLALLERDTAGARAAFTRLVDLGEAGLQGPLLWRGQVGLARTHAAGGEVDEARRWFAASEGSIDDELRRVPLGAARGGFQSVREGGTRAYLSFLVEHDDVDEAFALMRRSRRRGWLALAQARADAQLAPEKREHLRTTLREYRSARDELDRLAERDWELSSDELRSVKVARTERHRSLLDLVETALSDAGPAPLADPALRPAEAMLLLHPAQRGWVGVLRTPAGTSTTTYPQLDVAAPDAATAILRPWRETLRGATSLRVLPYGTAWRLDLHAAARADPGLAGLGVTWALDVAEPGLGSKAPRGTLVVVDPTGDLPGAREEYARLRPFLGPEAVVLAHEEATGPALRELLPSVDVFHYAGHGVYAGARGWESFLPLGDGTSLTVWDILTLPRAPRFVVLSGCETGPTSRALTGAGSMGLAQAFVVAGSEAVVAATRPVSDAMATSLMAALYRIRARGEAMDLPQALHLAQDELRSQIPGADWSAFRTLTR